MQEHELFDGEPDMKKEFTIDALQKMISDCECNALQILPDDVIAQHFPDYKDSQSNFRRAISEQDANALNCNKVDITKQLLAILKASPNAKRGQFSSEELETMLVDYETYWSDRLGRGDIEAENADKLSSNIRWITMQLIEVLST